MPKRTVLRRCGSACGGPSTMAAAAGLRAWRFQRSTFRYGTLKARRFGTPLWRLLGGHDPRVPTYAGGIDLDFSLDKPSLSDLVIGQALVQKPVVSKARVARYPRIKGCPWKQKQNIICCRCLVRG